MPRYIVKIKPENSNKVFYAVYSTIVGDWLTDFASENLDELRAKYPNAHLIDFEKLFGEDARAYLKGGILHLEYKVYTISAEEIKSKSSGL